MASSHKTEHYGLSQFAPLDRPAWLVDYNTDMEKIDTALHNLDETGGGTGTLDQTARDMAQAAQDAAKDAQGMATAAQATADEALEKAEEALNQQGAISGDITTAKQTAEEALELAQGCVKRSGDTMTGALKLAGDPVEDTDAANKGYVDSVVKGDVPEDMPSDFAEYIPAGFKFLASGSLTTTPGGFKGNIPIDRTKAKHIHELFFIARITNNTGRSGSFIDNSQGTAYALTKIASGISNFIATAYAQIGVLTIAPNYTYGTVYFVGGTQFSDYNVVNDNGETCTLNLWCHDITSISEVYVFWR